MTRHLVAWYTCDVMIAVNVSAMNVRSGGGGGGAAAAWRAILVLAAPARLALEVQVTPERRADPDWLEEQHRAIATAMGGEEGAETDAAA